MQQEGRQSNNRRKNKYELDSPGDEEGDTDRPLINQEQPLARKRNDQGNLRNGGTKRLSIKVVDDAGESNLSFQRNVTVTPNYQLTPGLENAMHKSIPLSQRNIKPKDQGFFKSPSVKEEKKQDFNHLQNQNRSSNDCVDNSKNFSGQVEVHIKSQNTQRRGQVKPVYATTTAEQQVTTTYEDCHETEQPIQQIAFKIVKRVSPMSISGAKKRDNLDLQDQSYFTKDEGGDRPSSIHYLCEDMFSQLRKPIRIESKFRTRWDIVIIALAMWICIFMPINIAFSPDFLDTPTNWVFNKIIDVCFIVDLLINFRTTIKNVLTGEEIFEAKRIAINYLMGRFLVDLIASIPLDSILIGDQDENGMGTQKLTTQFRIVQIFKLSRILRFTKIISYLNATESVKLSLKLFKLIFYLLIYIHLQACAWFFYTNLDRTWYPIPDLIKEEYHFYDHGFTYTYCLSVWHSVSILDGADMVPVTSHQAIVVSCLVFVSEFIHAHILGTIGVVLHALNHKSSKFQEQIEFVTSTMKNIKLQDGIQRRIIEYLSQKQNDMDAQKELDSLLSMISPNLKNQVTQHLFLSALKSVEMFNSNNDIVDFLVANIEAHQYMAETFIIKQGTKATHMYVLAQGECEILVKDQLKKEQFVRDIGPGSVFGEVALLFGTKRTASVRSREACTVGALSSESFQDLLQNYPEIEENLIKQSRQYKDHWKLFQIEALNSFQYLRNIPYEVKEELHYKLTLENFEKGAKIIQRGQECNGLFYIVSGVVDLVIDKDGKEYHIDQLAAGSTLGQYSVFSQAQFAYSVKSKTKCTLLALERDELLRMAEVYDSLERQIEKATGQFLHQDVPQCDYKNSSWDFRDSFGQLKHQALFAFCIQKVIALNKAKDVKPLRILELISQIKNNNKELEGQINLQPTNQLAKSGVQNSLLISSIDKFRHSSIKQAQQDKAAASPYQRISQASRRGSMAFSGSFAGYAQQIAAGDSQNKFSTFKAPTPDGMQRDIASMKAEIVGLSKDVRTILSILLKKDGQPSELQDSQKGQMSQEQRKTTKLSIQMSGIQESEQEESLADSSDQSDQQASKSESSVEKPKKKDTQTTFITPYVTIAKKSTPKPETNDSQEALRVQEKSTIQNTQILIDLSDDSHLLVSGQAPSEKIQGLVNKFLNKDFQEVAPPRQPVGVALNLMLHDPLATPKSSATKERYPPKQSESSKTLPSQQDFFGLPKASQRNSAAKNNAMSQSSIGKLTPEVQNLVETILAHRQESGKFLDTSVSAGGTTSKNMTPGGAQVSVSKFQPSTFKRAMDQQEQMIHHPKENQLSTRAYQSDQRENPSQFNSDEGLHKNLQSQHHKQIYSDTNLVVHPFSQEVRQNKSVNHNDSHSLNAKNVQEEIRNRFVQNGMLVLNEQKPYQESDMLGKHLLGSQSSPALQTIHRDFSNSQQQLPKSQRNNQQLENHQNTGYMIGEHQAYSIGIQKRAQLDQSNAEVDELINEELYRGGRQSK